MTHFHILALLAFALLAALFRNAECDYTSYMRPGGALLVVWCLTALPVSSATDKSPHELYDTINNLRVDPSATYELSAANRIELRRGDVEIYFEEGKLAFLAPLDGRVTGFVFSGRGHALAFPREPVEKQQMAHFLGAPVLDQEFLSAYVRFTDDAADDLLRQFHSANLTPQLDTAFASVSDPFVAQFNVSQSLRILEDRLSQNPKPYFYAALEGIETGAFDVLFDLQRREQVLLGQRRKSGNNYMYYDVWASYSVPGSVRPPVDFHALDYTLDTAVLPDNSLDAIAAVHVRAETSGERVLTFQLSRALHAETVSDAQDKPLAYFQNEGMNLQERSVRGNDYLHVVLPQPSQKGQEYTIHFHYRGNVIEDAGNGVLFVGARESWYPHLGDQADFASYNLTMRWPRHLKLVATGAKIDEQTSGDLRIGHWRSDKPLAIAGFNLGEYASSSIADETRTIDVYANRQLEQALSNRLDAPDPNSLPSDVPFRMPGGNNRAAMQPPNPSPADALKQLGKEIDSSIRFYENFSGPFPYRTLSVSQIPGTFGQGWPGLLYISTFSFLSAEAQNRAGLSSARQEAFTDIVPFHEVAHQWWGNVVGWSSYRDQWIDEAFANYLALLFAESRKPSEHAVRVWLERYRKQLEEKIPGSDSTEGEIGALPLGNRLNSSKSPSGFEEVIYSKGSWVIHMLREMLRQPSAKDPDARFVALLRTISSKYAYRAFSTDDLQREVEAVMTPAMDLEGGRSMEWFFEQWVRGTGIPHYRVEFSSHHTDKGEVVRGKLFQTGVPHSFIVSVPVFANNGAGHNVYLGSVIAAGPETSFHFTTQIAPRKLVIDPQMTLLCTTDQTEKTLE